MAAFETIEARLQLAHDQFTSGIETATDSLTGLGGAAENANMAVAGLGAAAAGAGAAGIAKSVQSFGDLDQALTESQAIMGDLTENEMASMEEAARDVGKQSTFSADEAGEAFYYLASAGMDAEQSVASVGEVAQFAQAGNFDLATATDLSTDALSALGMASDDATENQENLQRVMDTVVRANELANASTEEYSEALTNKAAPAMKNLGVDVEEGTSVLATFADQGLKGRRAGTILARTLEGLASSARDNADAYEELGVSVFDANGEMRPMQDITRDLEGALGGMSTEQRNAAMSQLGLNKRAKQGLDLMIGNSDAMAEYEDELNNAGGTTERVAEKQLTSLNNQWELMKSQIEDVFIEIGSTLAPALERILSVVTKAVTRFASFNDATDGMAGVIALLSMVVGGLATAFVALQPIILSAVGAVASIAAPVAAVIAAVAALGYAWQTNFAGIRDVAMEVFSVVVDEVGMIAGELRTLANAVLPTLKSAWDEHGGTIEQTINRILQFVSGKLISGIRAAGDVIRTVLQKVTQFWEQHGETIVTTVVDIVKTVISTFKNMRREFKIVGVAVAAIAGVFLGLISPITVLVGAVAGLYMAWQKNMFGIRDIVMNAVDAITATLQKIASLVVPIVRDAVNGMKQLWEDHGDTVLGILDQLGRLLREVLPNAIQIVRNAVKVGVQMMTELWQTHGKETLAQIRTLVNSVISLFNQVATVVLPIIRTALNAITTFWQNHGQQVVTLVTGFINALKVIVQTGLDILLTAFRIALNNITAAVDVFTALLKGNWREALDIVIQTARDNLQLIIDLFQRTFDRIIQFCTTWGTRIKNAFIGIIQGIIQVFQTLYQRLIGGSIIPNMLNAIITAVQNFGTQFINAVRNLANMVIQRVNTWLNRWVTRTRTFITNVINAITTFATNFLTRIRNLATNVFNRVETWLTNWFNRTSTFITNVIDAIVQFATDFLTEIRTLATNVFERVKTWLTNWLDRTNQFITDTIDAVVQFAIDFLDEINTLIEDITTAVTEWLDQWLTDTETFITDVIDAIVQFATDFFDEIDTLANDVIERITQFIETFLSDIGTFIDDLISDIEDMAAEFLGAIEDMASDVVEAVQDMASNIMDAIPDAGDLRSAGRSMIGGLVSGIRSKISAIRNAAGDVASAARNALPGSDAKEGPLSDLSKTGPALTETFAAGIDSSIGNVEGAASRMAGAAATETGDIPPPRQRGRGASHVDNSLTLESGAIQGVRDPDEVREEIDKWWRDKQRRLG